MKVISLAVVSREIEAGYLRYSIRRTRVKGSVLILRHLANLAEHFAGTCEIKAAFRDKLFNDREDMVCPVDIGIQRREFILEGVTDEALSSQVVTFIERNLAYSFEDA